MKLHLINDRTIGAEFGFYTKRAKIVDFVKDIVSFYNVDSSIYVVTVCGLDFNIEKLVLSLSGNAKITDDMIGNMQVEETNIITKRILADYCDLKCCLQYIDKFSEGSFRIQIFCRKSENSLLAMDRLLLDAESPLLTVEVFSDATYVEIISQKEFSQQLKKRYNLCD